MRLSLLRYAEIQRLLWIFAQLKYLTRIKDIDYMIATVVHKYHTSRRDSDRTWLP